MKNIFLIIVVSLISSSIFAKDYSGRIINKLNNEPVKYASIGIINKPFGTYSDENGSFKFTLKDYEENDSIRISCIGFKAISFNIKSFEDFLKKGQGLIYLDEKITQINEVVIYGNKYVTEEIGNKRSVQQLLLGFFGNLERGIVVKNNKKVYLKKVSFKLTMSGGLVPDSALFRFNIYNIKDNLPYQNILDQPIYFKLYEDQFYGTNEFDLSKYNISIEGDFAATFELIQKRGGGRIYFAAWVKGCPSIYRFGPQGEWINAVTDKKGKNLYQSLKLTVSYEKGEQKE